MKTAVIALGSNLGDCVCNLRRACAYLSGAGRITAKSGVYKTPPAFYENQPDFFNAAVCLETSLPPEALLAECKRIEGCLGRTPSFRNAPRPADLDILFYGDEKISTDALQVPHRGWRERAFVITPLLDLLEFGALAGAEFASVRARLCGKIREFDKYCDL